MRGIKFLFYDIQFKWLVVVVEVVVGVVVVVVVVVVYSLKSLVWILFNDNDNEWLLVNISK